MGQPADTDIETYAKATSNTETPAAEKAPETKPEEKPAEETK